MKNSTAQPGDARSRGRLGAQVQPEGRPTGDDAWVMRLVGARLGAPEGNNEHTDAYATPCNYSTML